MKDFVSERAVELGKYIVTNNATVRAAAGVYRVSKSTVFVDVTKRLEHIDPDLHDRVQRVLEINKAQRHIRGGVATREKYLKNT